MGQVPAGAGRGYVVAHAPALPSHVVDVEYWWTRPLPGGREARQRMHLSRDGQHPPIAARSASPRTRYRRDVPLHAGTPTLVNWKTTLKHRPLSVS